LRQATHIQLKRDPIQGEFSVILLKGNQLRGAAVPKTQSLFALVLAFATPITVIAQDDNAVPIEVLGYAEDSLGERLVSSVKGGFERSVGFRLTDSPEGRLQVMINTMNPGDEFEGQFTFFSVLWLITNNEYQLYLFDTIGLCSNDQLNATTEGILAKTDELWSNPRKGQIVAEAPQELGPSSPQATSAYPEVESTDADALQIPRSPTRYTIPESANQLIVGQNDNFELWFDNTKWQISTNRSSPDAEVEFFHVGGEVFAQIIAERVEFSLPTVRDFVLENLRSMDPNAEFKFEEIRTVNGREVLFVHSESSLRGVTWWSLGYLHSGSRGSIQLFAFTSKNLFGEFESEMNEFLNGLVTYE
jgi:hypothetical protein